MKELKGGRMTKDQGRIAGFPLLSSPLSKAELKGAAASLILASSLPPSKKDPLINQ